jgi:hypothetical protein
MRTLPIQAPDGEGDAMTDPSAEVERLPDDYDYAGLVSALRSGRQCDEDGTDIQVSHQAAIEGAAAIEQLRADITAAREEVERLRDVLQQIRCDNNGTAIDLRIIARTALEAK